MQWSKVKTVLIYLLLAVNIFLASNILIRNYNQQKLARENIANIVEIMALNGIECTYDLPIKQKKLYSYEIYENQDFQKDFATQFLGRSYNKKVEEDGTETFLSSKGKVSFYTDGKIYANILDDFSHIKKEDHLVKYIKSFIAQDPDTIIQTTSNGEILSCSVTKQIDDVSIEGYALTVAVLGDSSLEITGEWIFGNIKPVVYENNASMEDTLMFFMSQNSNIKEIKSMENCFYVSELIGGKAFIYPCWNICTDSGTFLVDYSNKNIIFRQ